MSPQYSHLSPTAPLASSRRTFLTATAAGLGAVSLTSCGLARSALGGQGGSAGQSQGGSAGQPQGNPADGTGDTTAQEPSATATQGTTTLSASEPYLQLGDAGKQPLLELFVDYLCPHCKEFSQDFGEYFKDVSDAGSVELRMFVRPMLDAQTRSTYSRDTASCAAAAYEQDPGLFWSVDKAFFDAQPDGSSGLPSSEDVYAIARGAGLNDDFLESVKGGAYNAFVDAAEAEGRARSIGTPTVYIDGTQFTNGDLISEIETAITNAT